MDEQKISHECNLEGTLNPYQIGRMTESWNIMGLKWMKKITYQVDEHAVSNGWKNDIYGRFGGEAPWYGPVVVIDISSGWTSHVKWMKNEVNEHFI
jgi:hypothetical protein